MTAVRVPTPQFGQPLVNGDGVVTKGWRDFLQGIFNRIGGPQDKVDAAAQASDAVIASRLVIAGAGLSGGGELSADITIRLYRVVTTVAALPSTDNQPASWAFATDGRKPGEGAAAGTGCPVIWTNGAWYSAFSGSVVAA